MSILEEEKVWEKQWDKSSERLTKEYEKTFRAVFLKMQLLAGRDVGSITRQEEQELMRFVTQYVSDLQKVNEDWVKEEVTLAFTVGQASSLAQLGYASSLKEGLEIVSNSQFAKRTVEAVMEDTFEDLLFATQNTEKRTKRLVRDIVSTAFRQKIVANQGRISLEREIKSVLTKAFIEEQLKNDGFVGIVDKAGRKWKVNQYVNMVTHTKLQESFRQGVITESVERGNDLVYISSHGAKDRCRNFEGLVLSLTGATKGYPTLDEIKSKHRNEIFHPYCRHKLRPVRDVSLLPPTISKLNDQNRSNVK